MDARHKAGHDEVDESGYRLPTQPRAANSFIFFDGQPPVAFPLQHVEDIGNLSGPTGGSHPDPAVGQFFNGDFLTRLDAQMVEQFPCAA